MNAKDYLWYPYLAYQKKCREEGREDTIQEWLILTGKIPAPPQSPKTTKAPPVVATTKTKRVRKKK